MFSTLFVHCEMNLKDFMQRYDISMSELARVAGLHRHTIANGLEYGFSEKQKALIVSQLHKHYGKAISDLGQLII